MKMYYDGLTYRVWETNIALTASAYINGDIELFGIGKLRYHSQLKAAKDLAQAFCVEMPGA